MIVPPLSIISSIITQSLPLTSPIIFITLDFPGSGLLLSIIAKSALILVANALVLSIAPASGETQIKFLLFMFFFMNLANNGVVNKLSTGISKKPWI